MKLKMNLGSWWKLMIRDREVIILAGGPTNSCGRNRHLEKLRPTFFSRPKTLIDHVIECCDNSGLRTRVAINRNNIPLLDHVVKKYGDSYVILVDGPKVLDTFAAIRKNATKDAIMVSGDLIGLTRKNINMFRDAPFLSAVSHYIKPWGKDLIAANGMIKRGDMGQSIWMLKFEDLYLLEDAAFLEEARKNFNLFYENSTFNFDIANHYITWIVYTYFHELMSDRQCKCSLEKGFITASNKVYRDND
jgi:GTP:adenosylcobinamide-phosphate guanylyltransferase